MRLLPGPPMLSGSDTQQLAQIRTYLFQQNEQLNFALSNNSIERRLEVINEALTATDDPTDSASASKLSQYKAIRSLLIKTADTVVVSSESFTKRLSGVYVTKGQFGTLLENTTIDIEGTPTGITQLFNYTSGIRSDYGDFDANRQTYIKTGLLYYDDNALPVYGVGVGELATKVTSDGKVVLDRSGLVGTYTADEITFWQNDVAVASISNSKLHMPAADITGGTLDIGLGTFKVNAQGEVTATAGKIGGCTIVDGVLQVGTANITEINADKIKGGTIRGVTFISQSAPIKDPVSKAVDRNTITISNGLIQCGNSQRSVDIDADGIEAANIEVFHTARFHENTYQAVTNWYLWDKSTGQEAQCLGLTDINGYKVPYFLD